MQEKLHQQGLHRRASVDNKRGMVKDPSARRKTWGARRQDTPTRWSPELLPGMKKDSVLYKALIQGHLASTEAIVSNEEPIPALQAEASSASASTDSLPLQPTMPELAPGNADTPVGTNTDPAARRESWGAHR